MLNTVIITEKNDVIRTGLKAAIEETDIAEVIGDYASVGEMLPYLKSLTPDVVILSGSGNILNRCLACYEIQSASPTTKTLTLTEEQRDDELRHLILSGASGCVTTSAGGAEIARSVGMVADGGWRHEFRQCRHRSAGGANPNRWSGDKPAALDDLTERERAILSVVGEGCSNEEIAQRLNLSKFTVRNNIAEIRSKLNVQTRSKLTAYEHEDYPVTCDD